MNYIETYVREFCDVAFKLDFSKIEAMLEELIKIRKVGGRLFIIGVGGSAGNANHAVNDFRKLANIETYAPTDNVSELTARANDEGFELIFSEYLKVSNLSKKDCVLILSVGGGDRQKRISENICNAIDFAKSKKTKILGIVGRSEGYTYAKADICILTPPQSKTFVTPFSETFQSFIWHLLVTHPRLNVKKTKW